MGLFDDVLSQNRTTNAGSGLFADVLGESSPKSSALRRGIADPAISLLKGAISVPEAVVGLADIPTLGLAGKAAEGIGFRPKEAKAELDTWYSPEQQAANRAVQEAKGFVPTLQAAVQNPSVIGHAVAESVPSMLGGAAIARGLLGAGAGALSRAVGPTAAPIIAGAAGEGIVGAGLSAEQIRQETPEGTLSPGQSAAAMASGIGTGLIGAAGGGMARKLGLSDVDTLLAGGTGVSGTRKLPARVLGGAVSEGVLEEMPQSAQEQAWQNVALGKPVMEGVPEQSALGGLAGTAMGMAGGFVPAHKSAPGPLEKAAAIGEKTGVNEMKRQEQALSLTGVENEVSQTGIQNQGNSEVSAGSPSGTEGTEQTDIAIGAGSTEPSGDSLGIGDIPAQPTDVAPATLSGPATTAPQDESQAADVEPPPLNTPAAPEPLPSPVSTAATSPQILQAESAGVPTLTTEGVSSNAPQTQEAVSPAPGRKEESASAPGAGGVTSAASADADRKKDVDALAIQAARLRESAALAIGQKRVALNALASRMEAAREAIVGRAEATHKDSLSVQPAPAKKGLDLSTRTDLQLTILERHRNQKVRELAAAERARRTANEQPMVDEQPTYQGMTVEEMARVASRHGHDYESAVEKIREKPRLWIEAVQKWIEIDDLEKKAEDKQKRAAKWTPNERQKKVISIVSESSTFSKSSDIPMFPQNSKSTRALMSRGILSRIDLGDLVEYRLNNLQADAEIARREGVPQGVAPVVANKTPSDAPQAALSVAGNQQNVPGDIPTDISAPKSQPAETNQSTTEAVSKKPKAVQNNLPPIARRDDLVGAIMRVTGGDGIHSSMAPDTVGDSANRATKLRGLFTKRGTIDLGDVAMRLREDEDFDVRDGEHLSEMIRQASFGEVPVSMARQERDADAAKEKEHRDRIREKAKKYGVKAVGVKFSDLESRVFAMMDARNKKAVAALDGRAQKRFEAAMSESQNALSDDELDAVLADLSQQGMSPRDFWNKATATVLKMAEEARQERALDAEPTTEEPSWFADFPDESGNRSTGSGRESQPVDQAPSQPGLELAGQTADELAKQEAERVAAEKAQKADKAQAEADEKAATGRKAIKQASDAAASTFELGGDAMANLTGQVDMFATVATSKPAAAPIKPEGGPEDAAQDRPDGAHVFLKAPDGTVDFGEITPAMAESMKRQAGKIRLERGDDSYGEQHIELRHGKDIRGVGFKSVAEFVSEALQNISAIWKPSKTSQLVVVEAIEHGKVVFVELKPSDSGDYYTVNSAFPTPANYAEKKGKSAGWVKLWSGMALPPSAPAARTPSADRPSEKAGEGDATPSSKSSDSSVVNQTSESKPANTEDAGAELTHNRRNRLTRGLKWEDLASKDEALRVKEATKAKVYPKPDYKAMIDAGMPPQLAHIIKQVYDSIAISPQTSRSAAPSDDDIKSYIAGVNRVMDAVVEWAGSVDRGGAWLRNTIARAARAFGSAIDFSVASHVEAQNSLVNAAFPGGYAPVRNELVAIGGNKVYGALQPGARELNDAAKAIKSGWPESQEAWQRQGITVVNGNDVKAETSDAGYGKSATVVRFTVPNGTFSRSLKVVTVKGTRDADSPEVRKAIVDGLAEYSGRFLLLSKVKSVVSTHATEDEAKAAARSLVSRDGRKNTVSDKGISVTAAERIGEARRLPGEDISSDRLRDTFKFKGVNFGNWMKGEANAKERQLHLNHAYDSFMDLADVLGVPPESMSLNGMLGVAIGAQGSGGFAAAHFVPGVNEINLTRESGAGSLAHEWGHALDHYFARQAGLTRATDPFLTAHLKTAAGAEIRQEILDKFKDIVQTMRKRPITLEEAVAQRQEKIASARRNLDGWLNSVIRTDMRQDAEILKAAERIKSGDLGDGSVAVGRTSAVKPAIAEFGRLIKEKTGRALQRTDLSAIDSWAENLKYLQSQVVEEATHVPQQMVDTRYARDAASLDKEKGGKPYWSTPLEMFARALDAFVSDTLEAKAAKNTYLSHAGRDGQTVPTGTERTAINAAIQGLVDTIETRAGENGNVLLFSREDSAIAGSSADRALYDMAQEGRTSAGILSFIGKASRRPFNRLLATHLARIGVSSTITLDSQGGWQFGNTSRAQRYAAAYNPRTDTVALFTPREAERHILHELVHAATLKAIARGGVSAMRMRRLFLHVQRSGRLSGQYGMSSLDEFVAEAFSNPRFQEALRSVPAPAGSILKSAWQWFVNIVARVLGFRTNVAKTALDRALTTGAQLMRENAGIAAEETRYSLDGSQPFDGREVALTPRLAPNGRPSNLNEHQWQQVRTPEFKAWFGDWESAAKLEWLDTGKPIAMMSGDEVPVFPKLKLLAQWVGKYWADEHGGGVVNPDLGRIVLDETAASFSIGHGLSRSKANAFYLVPKVLENGVVLGQLPKVANKPDAYVIAAPVAIGEKTYRELVEVRIDQNMHRMYVHEVVLREESPDSAFNSSAASSSGKAEPQGARHGAIWNFMLSLRKVKASRAVDANGEPLASQVDQWESDQSSGDIRFSAASDWYNGPSGAPVRNAWQRAKAKAAEILSPKNLDKIIYELQDKYVDLKRLREHIQSIGGTITDMNDAYLGEELYHKRLAHRTEEFLKAELRPLLAEMKARSVGVQDLETFLHARHAPEANAEMAKRNPNQAEIDAGQQKSTTRVRNLEQRLQSANAKGAATVALEQALNDARGELLQWNGAQAFRGTEEERRSLSGLSDAAAAAIMNGLTPERRANLDALAARVDALNEGTLQLLQSYGLMSRESLDTWRKTYQYYIPLHRDEAHPDSVNHPIGQGFSVKGDAAKRRTGSNQSVTNILGHIAMQREAALTRGEKNHVMRKLYLMARQNPLADVWKVGDVPTIDTIDKATGFVKTVPDPLYKTRPNVLLLRIAGKDVAIAMNEHNPQALRMAQALKNLDVDDLHYLIPVVGKMTRYFASINTQYNPIFGVINLMRDTQEAALNLSTTELAGKQKEVMTDTLSILKEVLKNKGRMPKTGAWATLFEEFNRVGGTTGYRDLFLDAESRSKSLLSELQALDRGKVSQAAHAVADWLSDYNEAMENATRLAAYKAAIDNGMSKERAASLAKNLTVNFNRKGRQTRELGALYAFFNAAVQGTTRMAQTLSGPAGRKILAGGVLLGVVNALLGIAMMGGAGDEDDEWEKIPEFVKERSIVIPTGKDAYLSIPMPLGFQFLPNIGRLAVEMAVYKDKTAGKQMVALFQVLADAFNPMGGSSPALQIAAPTVLDPFVALAQNKDWTGKPIFIENRNSLDPKPGLQRSKDSATPWAKGLADAINAITGGTEYTPGGWSPTPDQIDYVIGQLTGGIGREAGKVASTAAAPFTGEELPPYKIPLIGRLYGSTAGHSGQSEKFYENVTKANEAQNEIKGRVRAGISVADYLADHPGAISLAARGNVAERQVAALRKARHDVVTKGGPDEVSKVREINEKMAVVMRNFNKEVGLIGGRAGP